MTTINLRGNLDQAMSSGQLDGNFTTLGLTHGMNTSNVAIGVETVTATIGTITTANNTTTNTTNIDVSGRILVNETTSAQTTARNSHFPNAHSVIYTEDYKDHIIIKPGGAVNATTNMTYQRAFEGDAAAGIGVGIFGQFTATDVTTPEYLGGWDFTINNFTDTNNFDTKWAPYVYSTASGTRTVHTPIAIEHDNIEANAPVQLKSYSNTQRNALTNLVNGQLIYNTDTNKVQARVEGDWVDLH
jgi:hypothetical protein